MQVVSTFLVVATFPEVGIGSQNEAENLKRGSKLSEGWPVLISAKCDQVRSARNFESAVAKTSKISKIHKIESSA